MAGKSSKTARRSTPTTARSGLDLSPDVIRFITTGTVVPYAYILEASGHSTHSKVGSDTFYTSISTLVGTNVAERCARRAEELEALRPGNGWERAAAILRGTETWPGESGEDGE